MNIGIPPARALSELVIDAAKDWGGYGVTNMASLGLVGAVTVNLPGIGDAVVLQRAGSSQGTLNVPASGQRFQASSMGGIGFSMSAGGQLKDDVDNLFLARSPTWSHLEAKATPGTSESEAVVWTTSYGAPPVVTATEVCNYTGGGWATLRSRSTTGAVAETYNAGGQLYKAVKLFLALEAT